jgi:hypothetical protein
LKTSVFVRGVWILLIIFLVLFLTGFGGLAETGEDIPFEKWIGKTVNVRISCASCATSEPLWLKRAKIREVTDKGLVVIETDGFAYYFHKYMIKEIQIAK